MGWFRRFPVELRALRLEGSGDFRQVVGSVPGMVGCVKMEMTEGKITQMKDIIT